MTNSIIKAPQGAIYLSDFLQELPVNCLLNKRKTGCGGTELVTRNGMPSIIAMPYVALVKNKTEHRTDGIEVLGVYDGVTQEDIVRYARTHSRIKIAVTYDSLPRLVEALALAGIDAYRELFLLVDE